MAEGDQRDFLAPRSQFQFSQENRLVAEPEQTTVAINRWRLQWLCHELQTQSNATRFRDVLPWFTTFAAFLFALVPADFKDFLAVPASTWQAVAIICAILSGCMTVYMFGRAVMFCFMKPRETPEQIVQKLIREMQSGTTVPIDGSGRSVS